MDISVGLLLMPLTTLAQDNLMSLFVQKAHKLAQDEQVNRPLTYLQQVWSYLKAMTKVRSSKGVFYWQDGKNR